MIFFFQAEDGIRDYKVTGVQTCALPISSRRRHTRLQGDWRDRKSTPLNSSHLVISYAGFCLNRKSTRPNSSHLVITYAVFSLKKNKTRVPTGLACTTVAETPRRVRDARA